MDELTSQIKALGLEAIPSVPETASHPTFNQVDIYRSHIAEQVASITGVQPQLAYNALSWTNTLVNGDLMLPVPALRIKGKKPDAVALEISEKVPIDGVAHAAPCRNSVQPY